MLSILHVLETHSHLNVLSSHRSSLLSRDFRLRRLKGIVAEAIRCEQGAERGEKKKVKSLEPAVSDSSMLEYARRRYEKAESANVRLIRCLWELRGMGGGRDGVVGKKEEQVGNASTASSTMTTTNPYPPGPKDDTNDSHQHTTTNIDANNNANNNAFSPPPPPPHHPPHHPPPPPPPTTISPTIPIPSPPLTTTATTPNNPTLTKRKKCSPNGPLPVPTI